MRALVITPTYNEKENIIKLIEQINQLNAGLDILVIDDNSPDGTGGIIDELKMKNDASLKLNVIHRREKLGLGSAYRQGFKWAIERKYDTVFTMDADFSHNPDYLPEILERLKDNDLIIGSRYIRGGGTVGWPLMRKIISKYGNLYAKFVTGLSTNDNTSGFMCIKKEVLQTIDIDRIKTEGYSFLIELKFRTFKNKFRLCEHPIVFIDRVAGKSKISKKIIFEAIFLVWKLRFGIF